jgi:hypothetical protein
LKAAGRALVAAGLTGCILWTGYPRQVLTPSLSPTVRWSRLPSFSSLPIAR